MVSRRCKPTVAWELDKLDIKHFASEPGMVQLPEDIDEKQRRLLAAVLLESGLVLLDDKKAILKEKVKNAVIEKMVHSTDEMPIHKYSTSLSEKLGYDYTYLSNVFLW